ncbi:MAG: hypothetical protein ABUL53_09085 [Bradyrhizobium guangdongense]
MLDQPDERRQHCFHLLLVLVLEQSSKSLGEIGAILLKEQDREQMEAVLSSLDGLIKQTRERVRKLRGLTCPVN